MSRRLAGQFYFAFVIIYGVLAGHLSAQMPTHGEIAADILSGLRLAERANVSLGEMPDRNSVSFETFASAVIEGQERAIGILQEAATTTTSSVVGVPDGDELPDVEGVAIELSQNYLSLIDVLRNGQRVQRALMDPRNLNAGSILSLQAQSDQFSVAMTAGWDMLPVLATKLGWALVDMPTEDNEKITTLLISETERASIIRMLETYNFGADIMVDSPDRSQAGASAKLLWTFLNMPWETTDPQ
jgi:hypothetical protein